MKTTLITALSLVVVGCAARIEGEPAATEPVDGQEQAAILGPTDDRIDWPNASETWQTRAALSTAAVATTASLQPSPSSDGLARFWSTATHGDLINACPEVRFRDQPVRSSCSATLIADDLLVTAAHCVVDDGCSGSSCRLSEPYSVVFNSRIRADGTVAPIVAARDVYSVTLVDADWRRIRANGTAAPSMSAGLGAVSPRNSDFYIDLAVLRTDRPVAAPYRAVPVRRSLRSSSLTVLGYPSGLPVKVTPTEVVSLTNRHTGGADFFLLDADTFGGNSGSGVFDASGALTGVLFGQHVATDYALDAARDCMVHRTEPVAENESMAAHPSLVRSFIEGAVSDDLSGGPARACEGACRRGLEDVIDPGDLDDSGSSGGSGSGGSGSGGGCNSNAAPNLPLLGYLLAPLAGLLRRRF